MMIDDTCRTPAASPSLDGGGALRPATVALLFDGAFVLGSLATTRPSVDWLARIEASLLGVEPTVFWYLARSIAFVAFGPLWLSMALGLLITNRLARLWPGGRAAIDLHQYTSLLGLGFACFHALILTGDRYTEFTLRQVLLPFASANYRPVWVGLGQIALYLLALVVLSFYARRLIGYRAWRLIHYLSFAVFALALTHGLLSGTDSTVSWVQGLYLGSAASLLMLLVTASA